MTDARRTRGPIAEELPTTGDTLFRWRSYMPLVLVPLFLLSVADDRPTTTFAWEVFSFLVALSGLAARAFVIGTAPHGTSARGTRRPTADSLSTRGAYSIVRHPLYVANTLVALGCALLSGTWYLPLIVVLLSFIYHERIAAREEAFLQTTFGDHFRAWASEVPAMIPAFGRYREVRRAVSHAQGDRPGIARALRDRHGVPGPRHASRTRCARDRSISTRDGWRFSWRRSFRSSSW